MRCPCKVKSWARRPNIRPPDKRLFEMKGPSAQGSQFRSAHTLLKCHTIPTFLNGMVFDPSGLRLKEKSDVDSKLSKRLHRIRTSKTIVKVHTYRTCLMRVN
jgi:hypothetical protein